MSPAIKQLLLRVGLFSPGIFAVNSLLHYWWDGGQVNFLKEAERAVVVAVIIAVGLHFFSQKKD